MTSIRAIQVTGGIAIDGPDQDDAYSDWRARYEGEPQLVPCVTCNSIYCGPVACRTATTEPTQSTAAPRCRYVKDKTCDCGGTWTCVEAA